MCFEFSFLNTPAPRHASKIMAAYQRLKDDVCEPQEDNDETGSNQIGIQFLLPVVLWSK